MRQHLRQRRPQQAALPLPPRLAERRGLAQVVVETLVLRDGVAVAAGAGADRGGAAEPSTDEILVAEGWRRVQRLLGDVAQLARRVLSRRDGVEELDDDGTLLPVAA